RPTRVVRNRGARPAPFRPRGQNGADGLPGVRRRCPVEVAWSLFDPAHFDEWWGATTRRVTPPGAADAEAAGRVQGRAVGPVRRHRGGGPAAAPGTDAGPAAVRVVDDQTTVMAPPRPSRRRIGFG